MWPESRSREIEKALERASFSVDSATINVTTLRHQSQLYYLPDRETVALKERDALVLSDAETGQFITESKVSAATVHSVAFTQNDQAFALTRQPLTHGRRDRVKLWDAQKNSLVCVLDELPPAEAWSLAFSADGTKLGVGGEAGSVRVYDTRSSAFVSVLEGHNAPVRSLAFSPDGRVLTTASTEESVKLWNLHSGQADRGKPLAKNGKVLGVAMSPGANTIASVAHDGTLIVRNLPDGAERFSAQIGATGEAPLVFSADGKLLASAPNAAEGVVSVRDPLTGKEWIRLQGAPGVRSVAVSNDGLVAAGGVGGAVTVWQLPSGQPLATLPPARSRPGDQPVGTTILQLQFDPEGKRLAIARADGKVILWNPREQRGSTEFQGHRREVRSLAFSPDGAMLASADAHGRIVLWNVAPSQKAEMKVVLRDGDQWFAVARLAPDGSKIATGGNDKTVLLWDASTGRRRAMLLGHTSPVKALAFSHNGALLASASQREVITWDVASGKRLRTFEGASPLALSASGDKLAATVEKGIVAVWNAGVGSRKSTIRMLPDQPTALAFSPDGETLAITSKNQVKLWSASNGRERTTLHGYQGGEFPTIAFSVDGKTLASTGEEGTINLWCTVVMTIVASH